MFLWWVVNRVWQKISNDLDEFWLPMALLSLIPTIIIDAFILNHKWARSLPGDGVRFTPVFLLGYILFWGYLALRVLARYTMALYAKYREENPPIEKRKGEYSMSAFKPFLLPWDSHFDDDKNKQPEGEMMSIDDLFYEDDMGYNDVHED